MLFSLRRTESFLCSYTRNKFIFFLKNTKIVFSVVSRIPARTLHGDHSQALRNKVMNSFRNGQSQILVATNVAGRGLDVNDIKYVINFDFPQTVEEYIHKIGRTGRSNNSGTAYTFFTRENAGLAKDLISVLENTNQIISSELKELIYNRYIHSGKQHDKIFRTTSSLDEDVDVIIKVAIYPEIFLGPKFRPGFRYSRY